MINEELDLGVLYVMLIIGRKQTVVYVKRVSTTETKEFKLLRTSTPQRYKRLRITI